MKSSEYNIYIQNSGNEYAFNSITCAFAAVEPEFFEVLDSPDAVQAEPLKHLRQQMQFGGFLVDDDVDERFLLKMRSWQGKFSEHGLGLTIAPTLACNFACPYCYETRDNHMMSQEVQDAIANLVSHRVQRDKPVGVTWYGGEPLLALDIIQALSDRFVSSCKNVEANYSAYIITNGYLLDDSAISTLLACGVHGAQITIDGPERVHDTRRILVGGGRSFKRIVDNAKQAMKRGITVDIRINVDRTNDDAVVELLELLADEGFSSCNVSFGHVNAYTEACSSVESSCFNVAEYAQKTVEYQKALLNFGFKCERYPLYPGVKANYCCADNASSVVIDPLGYLYKCWNDVGVHQKSVGSVLHPTELTASEQMNLARYVLWSPFEHDDCVACKLLPICMGGCPYEGIRHGGTPECEKWKYNLKKILDFIVENEERLALDQKGRG